MLDENTFYTRPIPGDVACLVSIASSVSLMRKSVSRCPVSEPGCVYHRPNTTGVLSKKRVARSLPLCPLHFINDPHQRSF
jgi:hypothetical protein